ncbi:FAD-dependent monooxygenase [Variovorax sp. H27-G14]|uniref:FAD-dependent monooxygenase n=1 Tax=Variovorax sp. H27-G14 TaxID=3111914 RepID=UPI0038FC79AC
MTAIPKPQSASASKRTAVFIVGGGPVGLSMAILMNRFGIDFVMVERASSTTDHPKARGCWSRTMEIFRQWGIEDRMRARGLPDNSDMFAFVESMTGHEYGRTLPEVNIGLSPAWKCILSQDAVEEELLKHARESGSGRILYSTEFVDYSETPQGVKVTVRDLMTGETSEWDASYLIAADGAGSSVRRVSGLEMRGPSTMAVMANEYWKADLSAIRGAANTAAFRVVPKDPNVPMASVLNTNGRDRWLSLIKIGVDRDERAGERTDEEVVRLARIHTGLPNLDVQVINRSIWRLSRQVAAGFRKNRVFLVGDAAHRFPPSGGYGMNSGIQDAHNLAWKLAFVLQGRASDRLLDSYDQGRRPVAESNADFSYGNTQRFLKTDDAFRRGNIDEINFWIKDTENHVHSVGQSLGFAYDEGALIPDGTAKPAMRTRTYEPSDRPGGRFPHIWLDLARNNSTLDWFDKNFVLVVGLKGDAWLDAAKEVSARKDLQIETRQFEEDPEKHGLLVGLRGAVLVRPDGHVAWRMPWLPSDPATELASALEMLIG